MANRYWVGGTATWDGTAGTKWATTSGGAGGAAVPTSSDDVFFDAASGAVTVTTSGTTTDVCNNLDFTGFTGTLSHANNTTIQIYGNMKTVSGMTYTIGGGGSQLSFLSTATGKTLTTGTKTWPKMLFDGAGGDWALQDTLNVTSSQIITITNGTLKLNAQNVTGPSLSSSNSNTRGIDCSAGASTWTTGNGTTLWDISTSTNFTLTSGTNLNIVIGNTSNSATFAGGGLSYGNTSGTALTTGAIVFTGANTHANLTLSCGANVSSQYQLGANQTVTGTYTSNGNSVINRAYIRSTVRGTARTISAATVTVTNADFQDITGAGAGSWDLSAISGGSGDCGGNSGITFTTPANQYWVSSGGTSTGSMSAVTRWASSSGGTAGTGRSPLPQDTAYFDANSIDAGSRTITQDKPRIGSVNWTGVTNTPAWTKTTTCDFHGSIIMSNSMTQSGTSAYTYAGRGSSTLTGGSTTWTNPLVIDCVNSAGTLTLGGNFTSSSTLTGTSGTFAGASTYTTSFTTCTWNGGTFTETGNMTLTGAFSVTGGTFGAGVASVTGNTTSANSGGTINLLGILGSTTHNYSAGTTTVGASGLTGTTFTNSGGSFTLNGASTGMTGNMTLSGGTVTLNANYTTTGTLSTSNDMTLNVVNATLNTTQINIVGSGTGGAAATTAYTWVL